MTPTTPNHHDIRLTGKTSENVNYRAISPTARCTFNEFLFLQRYGLSISILFMSAQNFSSLTFFQFFLLLPPIRLFNSLLIFVFDVYTPTSHLSVSNKTFFFFQKFPILFERTRIHFRMFTNYYDAYVTPSYTIQSSLRPYHRQSQFFVIFFTLCELRSAQYIATTLLDCSHFVLFFFKRQSPFCFFGHSTVDV